MAECENRNCTGQAKRRWHVGGKVKLVCARCYVALLPHEHRRKGVDGWKCGYCGEVNPKRRGLLELRHCLFCWKARPQTVVREVTI